jgi:MFS family permease
MSATSISSRRLTNLLRYEWALEKKFYLLGTLGIFMISFGVFLSVWFNQYSGFLWRSVDYNVIFFGGFIFLSVFGVSQSFIDLREKNASIRYLTLPASTLEKYLIQVFLRLILPLIIYPIIFWFGANLSVEIYYFIQQSILEKTSLPEIQKVDVLYLYWIPNLSMELVYWMLFGLTVSIPATMFMGGIIFGKWNFIVMPAAVGGFLLLMFGSYFGLRWLLNASAFGMGDNYSILIDYPEVLDGVPLFIYNWSFLVWSAVFLIFVVTYFKLKEREV